MDQDGARPTFSLSNLRGTAGWVLFWAVLAAVGIIGAGFAFSGHVQF